MHVQDVKIANPQRGAGSASDRVCSGARKCTRGAQRGRYHCHFARHVLDLDNGRHQLHSLAELLGASGASVGCENLPQCSRLCAQSRSVVVSYGQTPQQFGAWTRVGQYQNYGSMSWILPSYLSDGTYFIKIEDATDPSTYGISAGFTVRHYEPPPPPKSSTDFPWSDCRCHLV